MDVRKLRGAFLRCRYSVLRLIAAIEAMLATYQKSGRLIGRLTGAGVSLRIGRDHSTRSDVLCFREFPRYRGAKQLLLRACQV